MDFGNLRRDVSSILILVSMFLVIFVSIALILTDFPLPVPKEVLLFPIAAAFAIFLTTLLELIEMRRGPIAGVEGEAPAVRRPSELIPSSEDLPGGGWKVVDEGRLSADDVAWRGVAGEDPSSWGFRRGFLRIFERGGRRVAFSILEFSSRSKARRAFKGISEDWGERTKYSVSLGDEAVGIYSRSMSADGVFFRSARFLVLVAVGGPEGSEKGDSTRYAPSLTDLL